MQHPTGAPPPAARNPWRGTPGGTWRYETTTRHRRCHRRANRSCPKARLALRPWRCGWRAGVWLWGHWHGIGGRFVHGHAAPEQTWIRWPGTAFKREVIAEGVKTVAHGTALLQLGCELAQGYRIAWPTPPDRLPGWAATWKPDEAWSGPMNSSEASRFLDD